jgi:hypothetical protein
MKFPIQVYVMAIHCKGDMALLADFIMHCFSEITQQLSRKYIVVT